MDVTTTAKTTPMENSIDVDVVPDSNSPKTNDPVRRSIRVWIITENVSITVRITMVEHNANVIPDSICLMIEGLVLTSMNAPKTMDVSTFVKTSRVPTDANVERGTNWDGMDVPVKKCWVDAKLGMEDVNMIVMTNRMEDMCASVDRDMCWRRIRSCVMTKTSAR